MRSWFVMGALAVMGCSGGPTPVLVVVEQAAATDGGADKATDIAEDAGITEDSQFHVKSPAIETRDADTRPDIGAGGSYVGPSDPALPKPDAGPETAEDSGLDAAPACLMNTNCVALGPSSACGGDSVPWRPYQCAAGAEVAKAAGCVPSDSAIHFCCDPTLWCP